MKKTLYINLNGYAFHIEEDAYEKLKLYLDKIEHSFTDKEEAKEILEDIEARIAELFRNAHASSGEVISLDNVEEMIKTMGEPQDIVDDEEESTSGDNHSHRTSNAEPTYSKRLYRDTENRVFGGVCSGLGAYFNLDPIIFRVLFVVAVVFYGFSIIPYILLWIIMPKAVTIKQKLEMKGPAAYEKWEHNIREEYREMNEKFQKSQAYKNFNQGVSKSADRVSTFLHSVIRMIGIAIGVILMLVVIAIFISLVITFTFGITFFDFAGVSTYITSLPHFFLSSSEMTLGISSIIMILGIPLLLLFFLGFKLVFKFKTRNGLIVLIAILLWIGGVGMLSYTVAHQSRSYIKVESERITKGLAEPLSSTIYIKSNTNNYASNSGEHLFDFNQLEISMVDEQLVVTGTPQIKLIDGPELTMEIKKTSRGSDKENALDNCKNIEYFWLQKDSVLYIDPVFSLAPNSKIRDQRVKVIITVPEHYQVDLDGELTWVVDDERALGH